MRPVLLLTLPLFLTACGEKDEDDTGGSGTDSGATSSNPLAGHDFLMTDLTSDFEPVTDVGVDFDRRELSTRGGCNDSGGSYRLDGDVLVVTDMWSTDMGCEDERLHAQDAWLADFLMDRPTWTYDDPVLVLQTDDTKMTLTDREIAVGDKDLVDTVWVMDSIIDGKSVMAGSVDFDPTWTLHADGSVDVATGCHTGTGSYEVDGTELRLGSFAYSPVECSDSMQMEYDEAVRLVLNDGTIDWEIDESRLTLMRGSDGLMARAAE